MESERCIMTRLNKVKYGMKKLISLPPHEKMIEFCGLLTAYFERDGIYPIIVGGLSVEIYTRNHYTTHDIDLISDGRDKFNQLLTEELNFKKEGRSWYHEKLEIAIEIPDNHLEGNTDKILNIKLPSGNHIYLIGIEDIIIHRLESALVTQPKNPEWTDDYEWAKRMFLIHCNDNTIMDLEYLVSTSKDVGVYQLIKKWIT